MPRAIRSDVGAAQGAVGKFNNLSSQMGHHFDLNRSNIAGMKQAVKVSNHVVEDLSKLQSSIKEKADQFPQLARVIEQRDKQDSVELSSRSWGFE
ncbi:hypothetical protein [Pseudolactococcus paracarnosus]|uniref:Type VII secretion effector n=1 Tax=Pseudolactococcus paracarnosus TaxID=2749962 RepID=A0ABT0AJI3_9LACT|nr:hypothetical protein [Lactococcus paracarnosus]MCJ1976686.1 hypothetical protein [Lactococcus paracarnosus]MCJ1982523.1 hypothetical protein [Lactococcus paracarnosus]MCJ1998750.1 hypothetical protein [Lactococcus paracarnosus]